jgi:very-short-patch-repair endonuclease
VAKRKSPIEVMLIRELQERVPSDTILADWTMHRAHGAFEPYAGCLLIATNDHEADAESYGESSDHNQLDLYSNVVVGDYRLDLVLSTFYGSLAIECDGHDWHDRTKQQAAYDRARDRFFLSRLLPTIRFTGSEIVHSASKCALEVYSIAAAIDRQACALAHSGFSITGTPYRRYE